MKHPLITLLAVASFAGTAPAAVVILDLGTVQSGIWTDATLNRTYNAVTFTGSANFVARPSFYTSASLTDVTNSLTGWSVNFSKGASGDMGSSGVVWTGLAANAAAPFTGEAADALQDGFYLNNSGVVTINFGNLIVGQSYNLAAFGALTGSATTPSNFSLTTGTSASTTIQSLDLDTNASAGLAAVWNNVLPNASGVIAFTVQAGTATSGQRTELNAVRLESVPEPSTYGLIGAGALAAVAFVRRRRKRWANETIRRTHCGAG